MIEKRSEKGQAIIIIAFAILALLGFAALAIDGGLVYADRRHAQSSSDAGSLAGGGFAAMSMENYHITFSNFSCASSNLTAIRNNSATIATNRAVSNGFDNSEITVTTECEDDGSNLDPKYIDVITEIVSESDTALIHFVYPHPVVNRVKAVTRVRPRMPLAFGHAVVALNDENACDNNSKEGVVFSGSGETDIDGGGVWSNGCLKGTNSSCEVIVVDGDIQYAGGRFPSTGDLCETMDPDADPSGGVLPEDSYRVPELHPSDCSASNAVTITNINNSINLNDTYPGKDLICISSSGNAIKLTGSSDTLIGEGVTLYLVNGGDIEITGGEVYLTAPTNDPDPSPALPGVLIYIDPAYHPIIKLVGNSLQRYLGVIYVPGGDIQISGTEDMEETFNTQIIGYNVEISGSSNIDINFDENWAYTIPSSLDLHE